MLELGTSTSLDCFPLSDGTFSGVINVNTAEWKRINKDVQYYNQSVYSNIHVTRRPRLAPSPHIAIFCQHHWVCSSSCDLCNLHIIIMRSIGKEFLWYIVNIWLWQHHGRLCKIIEIPKAPSNLTERCEISYWYCLWSVTQTIGTKQIFDCHLSIPGAHADEGNIVVGWRCHSVTACLPCDVLIPPHTARTHSHLHKFINQPTHEYINRKVMAMFSLLQVSPGNYKPKPSTYASWKAGGFCFPLKMQTDKSS